MIVATAAVAALVIVLALLMWSRGNKAEGETVKANVEAGEHKDEHGEDPGGEVALSPEALEAAGVETEGVTRRPAVALLNVTGTVEVNQLQSQAVTPLVGGRVERVHAAPGDTVRAGQVLAVIASPQIAQMHGKLHEAETRYELAKRNLARVERAENRVAVISSKARLDEAEANLRRVRRLVELGAGAGKDLVAAEAARKTAKAEYDFQSNISLNKELQEAKAELETSRVDMSHIRAEMSALGAPVALGETDDHDKDTSLIALRAPASGAVTERHVNAGAGIEAGQALFTIANLSTVWVIANVPEAQVGSVRVGTPAEVRSAALGTAAVAGRVSYINPQLDEETRTAQVRVEVGHAGGRLKPGMFVEVGFHAGGGSAAGEDLMAPSAAVQRVGDRAIVFIPKDDEPGHFEVRDVELGGEAGGYRKVLSGLSLGERVVTKGGFALKTQLLKGEMGEDEH
ncbi:MAG TPA: efflux RND transporter periplasmic adaptor subunit, partial [Pyrinomonadaceae bacterium]|nr:efflux RND transporter periplasmic adaptor subunit [Pyrinomonadaceae bacterium]